MHGNKTAVLILLVICFSWVPQPGSAQVKTTVIDGIKHIQNPDKPLKGTLELKLEKIREINPYDFPAVGFRYYKFIRSQKGEVILCDPFSPEGHLFDTDGNYVRPVAREGQGPGEFLSNQGLVFHFFGDEIWGSSHRKIARFDRRGELLNEQTFKETASMFIENRDIILDKNHHICLKSRQLKDGENRMVVLEPLFDKKDEPPITFFEAVREWYARKEMGVFTNEWGTPNIWFAYSPEREKVFTALSTEYLITVYDLKGRPLHRIEGPHAPIKIGRREKALIIPWAAKDKKQEWALEAFPDNLTVILSLHTLPEGYLAVLRITGPKEVEIDIFDPEGRYIYALQVPKGMSLEQVQFFDRGFATQEMRDDYPVYVEYRVTNLPDIFK